MSRRTQRDRIHSSQQAPPPFETRKAEYYRYVYATSAYGGLDPKDSRLIFYLDRVELESVSGQPGRMRTSKIIQELQVEVHMSPLEFKNLAQFMTERIQIYEEQFGEITLGRVEPHQTVNDTPPHIA